MNVVALIPARLASTRFPEKPLALILGKPMIIWVAELTAEAVGKENVYVATDHEKIATVVKKAGFQVIMTSSDALTGTDRLAEAARQIDADLYINVQGDEPMLDPQWIARVIECSKKYPQAVINCYTLINDNEDPSDPNLPKCVVASDGRLLYMSRAAVPAMKAAQQRKPDYYKQVCIYAFGKAHLEMFDKRGVKATCEQFEDIEILRFLDIGIPVQMLQVENSTIAVDVPEDVVRVEQAMTQDGEGINPIIIK